MEIPERQYNKHIFSGHDTFQCRQLWLKKGYDFVLQGGVFNDESAVVSLGVGKNMVSSIRYWLRSFNIIDPKDNITEFGRMLLDDAGWDPFLEDEASFWLLHYQLVKTRYASTYSLIFNEFRKERMEFVKDTYVGYIKRKSEVDPTLPFNQNTVEADFDVFRKMYLSHSEDTKGVEDNFAGILCNLNLVKAYKKERVENDGGKEKKSRIDCLYIENEERNSLPKEVFLFAVLDNKSFSNSISLQNLESDIDSPGAIFALNRAGLLDKIEEITDGNKNVVFNDHAGVKELQFKKKAEPFSILNAYYAH